MSQPSPANRPNILFITADQWRGDCLSAFGHPVVETPAIDALAAEGVAFRKHYCQSVPCGPSRASLYTGLYLHNHRSCTNGTPLDRRHTNIALEARALGYDPVLFGYTDTSPDPRGMAADDPALTTYEGILPGFRAEVDLPDHHGPWYEWLANQGYVIPRNPKDLHVPDADYPGAAERGPTYPPPRYKAEHTETAFLTGEIMRYIGDQNEPWFVHASYIRPHPPYVVPEPYNALYDPADVPAPNRLATCDEQAAQHPWLSWILSDPKRRVPDSDRDVRQLRATYYGMMREVDDQLGRLFRWLKETGRDADTVIVFGSDHGELAGDYWLHGKQGWFDGAFNIPLIIRDPRPACDGGRGTVVDRFTENVDVMPTLLNLLGADGPLPCDGRPLTPFLHGGEPQTWRDAVHWQQDFRDPIGRSAETTLGLTQDQCALTVLRDDDYKYVHFTALPPLFFDLRTDPNQQRNVAADPAYASKVLEYAQKMLSWRMNHEDNTLSGMRVGPGGVTEVREARY